MSDESMPDQVDRTRRGVLAGTASLCVAGWLVGGVPRVAAQDEPITIDRDVGDRVVLLARPDAAVTGTSTLQPNTDFLVRVYSQYSPPFDRQTGTVVREDGTWSATLDLSDAVDDQPITVEVVFNDDVVATAGGVIGPLSATVRFDDQDLAVDESRVVIAGVRLEIGGFIVITDAATGMRRGVSDHLEGSTTHSDIPVTLDTPVVGTTHLVATAWLDIDGDRAFDAGIDRPYPEGRFVSDVATVRAPTPVPDITVAPSTETPPPPPSSDGLDVVLSIAGGALGVAGLRRTTAWVRDELYRRRDDWNRPPVAQIVSVPEHPRPGVPVLFDGSLSFDPDPDDAIERYEWSIGGIEARGGRRIHVFGSADEYDVELRVTDGSQAVGRQEKTVTVETRSGRLELAAVDPADPTQQSLTFRNAGDAVLSLGGWSVHEAIGSADDLTPGSRHYTFPDQFTLAAAESVSLHTGMSPDDGDPPGPADHHLYWESSQGPWDARSDALVITDGDGNPVFGARYERADDDGFAVERVQPAAVEDWFEPVTAKETIRIPGLGVTAGPRVGIRAIRNGIDFVAAGLFLQGPDAFASVWSQISAFIALFVVTWLVSTGMQVVQPSIEIVGPLLALLGAVVVTTVGGLVAATARVMRWALDKVT